MRRKWRVARAKGREPGGKNTFGRGRRCSVSRRDSTRRLGFDFCNSLNELHKAGEWLGRLRTGGVETYKAKGICFGECIVVVVAVMLAAIAVKGGQQHATGLVSVPGMSRPGRQKTYIVACSLAQASATVTVRHKNATSHTLSHLSHPGIK